MNTSFWGPDGWLFLHSIASIYPIKPSTNDKLLMHDFMNIICNILPCKYCRVSFTNYSKTLDIIPYLESNILMGEWLYKMHNKVNNKLRKQGYCTILNPSLEEVNNKYTHIVIQKIEHIYKQQIQLTTTKPNDMIILIINYICNLGYKFIGSIIFNYQGYYANCHSSDEKNNIISIYNNFFNILQLLICNYISKHIPNGKIICSTFTIHKINIKNILKQNESYSKLKQWFYNNNNICTNINNFNTYNEYEKYFNKHIVSYCNAPTPSIKNITNSCRKFTKKQKIYSKQQYSKQYSKQYKTHIEK